MYLIKTKIDTTIQGCGSATRFRDCRTKKKIKKLALSSLSTGHVSARRSRRYITRRNTKFVLADYTKCTSHAPDLNMDSCFLPMQTPFFLAL